MGNETLLPVIQADRDAAAAIVRSGAPGIGNGNKVVADRIKGGLEDSYLVVQSYARHRLSSTSPVVPDEVERLRRLVRAYRGALSWIDKPFTDGADLKELQQRIQFALDDATRADAKQQSVVPDERLREALEEARRQLEYLDGRFPTGTTPRVLEIISAALNGEG